MTVIAGGSQNHEDNSNYMEISEIKEQTKLQDTSWWVDKKKKAEQNQEEDMHIGEL